MTLRRVVLVVSAPLAFFGAVLTGILEGDTRGALREFRETWTFLWRQP